MQSDEIRKRFVAFFEKRGHTVLPSASLVPENDPTVLFTTAGMQPLIPYLLGTPHPRGNRLVNVQKCVRTQDIEEVGDNTHDTFFEMLGNWSLGDYFKKDAITWSYEFLTSKDEGLGLDPNRLYVTCFEGDENAPRDEESAQIWKELFEKNGISTDRIFFLGKEKNWWTPGPTGPCGPDTEMFYDVVGGLSIKTKDDFWKASEERQDVIEIWNDVFMEYEQKDGKVIGKLAQKNVDTGAGLERLTMMLQGKNNIFDTDLFADIIEKTKALSHEQKHQRIIADHLRTAIFMIADGVTPSNTDRGYILRRLIRRAIIKTEARTISPESLVSIIESVCAKYNSVYTNLSERKEFIKQTILDEQEKFLKTISDGLKEFEKKSGDHITGAEAFVLFSTYGFPLELTKELAHEKKMTVDEIGFEEESRKHQDTSRAGAEQKFKGGLADTSEQSVKYHTATHLLHKALRDVLGETVFQKGSNITPERLRFDFAFPRKMTPEEIKTVEDQVNEKIKEAISVTYEDISKEEASTRGAIGLFEEKYGDIVRVYKIGNYSLEYCGGPHVTNTSELGTFKIAKEEAVAAGIRRIKAVLS
jgi:alanyl-tRNA synthetase